MLKALEDPEQKSPGPCLWLPTPAPKHAQSQVTVIVSVPFTDDVLVGRMLSINYCIRVLVRTVYAYPLAA